MSRVESRIWGQRHSRATMTWLIGLLLVAGAVVTHATSSVAADPVAGAKPSWELARYFPAKGLFFLLEFDGLNAHSEALHKSAAFKILTETTLGALLEDLMGQLLAIPQVSLPPALKTSTKELRQLAESVARNGFAVAAHGDGSGPPKFTFVVKQADTPTTHRLLEAAVAKRGPSGEIAATAATKTLSGRTLHALDNESVWWFEKGDLVISSEAGAVIETLDGKTASGTKHPLFTPLTAKTDTFEPFAAGFFDLAALPPLPAKGKDLGLDGIKYVELQWGFQDDALRTVFHVVAPSPRRGILAFLDQPTFDLKSLPRLPADSRGFSVLSFDLAKIYDRAIAIVKESNPEAVDQVPVAEEMVRQQLGMSVRGELLPALGTKLAIYAIPPAGAFGNLAAQMVTQYAGQTISIEVKDEAVVSRVLEPLINLINGAIRQGRGPNGADGAPEFHKAPGSATTYVMDFPAGMLPPPFGSMFRPTITLTRNQLIVAASSSAAERAAALSTKSPDELWKPDDSFAVVGRRLPAGLFFLSVDDSRVTIPAMVQALPILVSQLNLMVPAVEVARTAATNAQSTNNLKLIGLAFHTFHDQKGVFPKVAITDKKGKPLLSWRVAILPMLEMNEFYQKFKLDEPWDSPANLAVAKVMPDVYRAPNRPDAPFGTTVYRGFRGKGAMFDDTQAPPESANPSAGGVGLASVTDGTSNTILVAEAEKAVPWTKPDELEFDPEAAPSLYGAGSPGSDTFLVLMGDGSVRTLAKSISKNVFRSLVTRNGGEVIAADEIGVARPTARPRPGGTPAFRLDMSKMPRTDELVKRLSPATSSISVDDTGVSFVGREAVPSLTSPSTSAVLIALLLPAVQAAREAARRAQCVNNEKQIALAMLNYESANGVYPKPAITDKKGKPLLSWRVAILPFIEKQDLYNRFDLDEPWDSPHNKALLAEMPTTYLCPSRPSNRDFTTTYQVVAGPGTMFEKGRDVRIADITDGTSNTIMLIEASKAVPWTKPDDVVFDPKAKPSLNGAGSQHPGGFNATFGDGSVRFLKSTISVDVLRSLFTRAGGEVIRNGAF